MPFTLGLVVPDDSRILAAAERTGLLQSVIQSHPEGLQQKISEGGMGLSGGQKQLVNLTRVVLREPSIWLLDEPTSNVDKATEQRIIQMLAETLKPTDTLILVTHKPELLVLVQRLLIVAHGNSIRALIKHLDGISNDDIVGLEIPNGVPVIYELDAELRPISRRFLEA